MQLVVATKAMAEAVTRFLDVFARAAPLGRRDVPQAQSGATFEAYAGEPVEMGKRSVADQTRRVLITVLGGLLVVGGILITWLPGPWSFPIVIAGLAILGSEYDWAKDTLDWAKEKWRQGTAKLRARREPD